MKSKRPWIYGSLILVSIGLTSCATDEMLFAEYDMRCQNQMCLAPTAEVMYQVETTSIHWESAVYFGYDQDELSESEKLRLAKNVEALLQYSELRVNLQAFTDTTASEAYNLRLSDRRRQAVERYLLEAGIEDSRIVSSIAGEMLPIHGGDSVVDKAINRRVELMLIDTNGAPLSFTVSMPEDRPEGGYQEFSAPYPDRKIIEE